VVIELRRDVVPEVILNQLYKNTSLQTSFGVINLCLVDNAPKILSIVDLLKNYLEFQIEVIRRRTNFLLEKDEARIHIVEGLLIAHDNIDEVVDIIKASATPEAATTELMAKFGLTEVQVQSILGMALRRLTGIETDKLLAEKAQLEENIANYHHILESRENIIEVIEKELLVIKDKFGDNRRTVILDSEGSIDDEDLIPVEDIVVTITKSGYIKRLTSDTFRTQNRGGRGVRGMSTNENDVVDLMLYTNTHTDLLFFTNKGKVYRIRGHQVPEFTRQSKGIPVVNLLNIEQDECVKAIVSPGELKYDENGKLLESYLFFVTKKGIVKRTSASEFISIRQNGKIAIGLREDDMLLDVKATDGNTIIGLASSNGKMVKFHESEVRAMGRTASGVKGINLEEDAEVVGVTTSLEGQYVLAITDKGYGKLSPFEEYRQTSRGAKGVITIKATEKVGNLVSVRAVNGDEDLMVITKKGVVIRTPISQIKIAGRNTQGVKIIRIDEKTTVSSIAIVAHEDEPEEVPAENVEVPAEEENPANEE
jgi:DNA gyrase subunit A